MFVVLSSAKRHGLANFERISELGEQLDQVDAIGGDDGHALLSLRRWRHAAQFLHALHNLGVRGVVLQLGVNILHQVLARDAKRPAADILS